jgi:ABC-2 type transport system ATP-binding protein
MIEVRELSKNFDDFPALKTLTLHVGKGSIYGLIGVNGSGKTTLLKHLTGILQPDSGDVRLDGEALFENQDIKQKVAFIPDELYFFGNYNIRSMARFYSRVYKNWNAERFEAMLKDFALPENKRVGKFSKGMQKQAAFILAMSSMPEYLILDEPIDGLDPLVRRKVWHYVVEDVAERQMTVLVSSHNLREMEDICDSIGIMSKGSVALERELDDLKSDVHKIQTALPEGTDVAALEAQLHVLTHEKRGSIDLYICRDSREKIEDVFGAAKPGVLDILPLTLEEIFIYEMGGENDEIREILR